MSRRRRPVTLLVGGALVALVVVTAAISLVWTPSDPTHVVVADHFIAPGHRGHLLGTDPLGRDILSLIMAGARQSFARHQASDR